jgi:hypothetical protein
MEFYVVIFWWVLTVPFFEKFIWILGLISIGLTEGSVNSSFFEKFGVVGIYSSFTNRPISAPGGGGTWGYTVHYLNMIQ